MIRSSGPCSALIAQRPRSILTQQRPIITQHYPYGVRESVWRKPQHRLSPFGHHHRGRRLYSNADGRIMPRRLMPSLALRLRTWPVPRPLAIRRHHSAPFAIAHARATWRSMIVGTESVVPRFRASSKRSTVASRAIRLAASRPQPQSDEQAAPAEPRGISGEPFEEGRSPHGEPAAG